MTGAWQVGVDIGGTFTDVIAVDATTGAVRAAKVRTAVGDPLASIDGALSAVHLSWVEMTDLMHGTTMATNAIVEDKLAPVVLVCTEGFSDTLAIARQNRRELYRLDVPPKLPPLVPDDRRLEVEGRLDSEGREIRPLSQDSVDTAIRRVKELGAEAVAVTFLHSYANPDHEEAFAAALDGHVPHIALSHRMNPEAREYARMSATVLNAALMPLTAGYLDRLLGRASNRTRIHLFHSAGGMASPDAIRGQPLALALSGPAAGVAASSRVAGALNLPKVISFDMGGTTTDVCLITDATVQISSERSLAGRPIRQPMVAVESIGAGGGSIARLEHGAIRVGPDSAGAEPGPACYGLGGEKPTVTDANLVLGYLSDTRPLGGTVRIQSAAARAAIAPIATRFGISIEAAARGIHRVANANMMRALRRVTVEHGVDARDCALLAFGGAGPMHAVELARELGISRVVVPQFSSMFSALGCLSADLSYAQQQTVRMPSEAWDDHRLEGLRRTLLDRLSLPLVSAGYALGQLNVEHVAGIRYAGQSYAVEIPCSAPLDVHRLEVDFKARHQRLYGFATDEPWELQSLRLRVSAPPRRALNGMKSQAGRTAHEPMGESLCSFGGLQPVRTPRFDRDGLEVDRRIAGPAVIEDDWSTIVVNPGAAAWADAHGHLHIDVGAAE